MSDTSTFCFVHCADLHLDTPFAGIHETAPEVAQALCEASLEAFDAVIQLAIDRAAAFLLVAGDVYDGAERGLRAQLHFRAGLARLDAAGIASFVVYGNHDPVETGWSALSTFPPLVTIFAPRSPSIVPVLRDGEQIATVQGVSYAQRAEEENLARLFRRPDGPGLHVGLLHCNVEGSPGGHANYAPCTIEDLRATELDYLALGHVHQRRTLAEGSGPRDPWIVYPGNTQARSPRLTEAEPKGALVVEVEHGRVARTEFVECDRVRFVSLECSIDELEDLGDVEDQLEALADDAIAHNGSRSVVLRARLIGRGELHSDLARPGVVDELRDRLRERTGDARAFRWWDEIRDETSRPINLAELKGRGDFTAELIAAFDDADAVSRDQVRERLVAELPRALQRHAASVLEGDRLSQLQARALLVALDELERHGA